MDKPQYKKCNSTFNHFEKNYNTNKYFNLCNLCRTKCCFTCETTLPLSEYDSDKRSNDRYNDCRKCRDKQHFSLCNPCCHTCTRTLPLSEYDSDKRLFKPEPYKDCRDCREKQKQEREHKYYEENKDRINQRERERNYKNIP